MIINGQEVVLVELFGKASYSGQSESHSAFMTKEMYEKYEDDINSYTPYFHELDGKHSEVIGEVIIHEDGQDIAAALARKDDDCMIYESLLYNIHSEDLSKVEELNESIQIGLRGETVVFINHDVFTV